MNLPDNIAEENSIVQPGSNMSKKQGWTRPMVMLVGEEDSEEIIETQHGRGSILAWLNKEVLRMWNEGAQEVAIIDKIEGETNRVQLFVEVPEGYEVGGLYIFHCGEWKYLVRAEKLDDAI